MGLDINKVYTFVQFIANKNQAGGYLTPARFNLAAVYAQQEIINEDYQQFQSSQFNSDVLSPLIRRRILNPNSEGVLAYPSDYMHTTSIRAKQFYTDSYGATKSREVNVDQLTDDELGFRLSSDLLPPTEAYPISCQYDTFIQFYPTTIASVIFTYIKKPTDPDWAYTLSSGRPVYNAGGSVQFTLPDNTLNRVAYKICSYLGINIREQELYSYAEQMKQAEK